MWTESGLLFCGSVHKSLKNLWLSPRFCGIHRNVGTATDLSTVCGHVETLCTMCALRPFQYVSLRHSVCEIFHTIQVLVVLIVLIRKVDRCPVILLWSRGLVLVLGRTVCSLQVGLLCARTSGIMNESQCEPKIKINKILK